MLSSRLTEIFDVIERSGNRGITREVLGWMFYGNKSKCDGQRCVAVSINHINDKLCSTDYQIRMTERFGQYRLMRIA